MQPEPITFEWETSKENVQPLRGGRKVDAIKKGLASKPQSKGLQVNSSFDDLKRHVRGVIENILEANYFNYRQEHENQIKYYKGEDPLSSWIG